MLELKKIEISDIPILKKFLSEYQSKSCDCAVCSLVMWRDYYNNSYAIIDDTMVLSSFYNGELSFTYPMGKNPSKMIDEIKNYCSLKNIPIIFFRIDSKEKQKVVNEFPNCKVIDNRDWFDYVYDFDSVTDLTGKSYAQKRNQIHRFEKNYDNYSFEIIDNSNINDVIKFNKSFSYHAEKEDDSADVELNACTEFLENFDSFGLPGYLLRIDGNIVGYTVGEIIGDMLFIHIEKADTQYKGIYQMLFNLFLKAIKSDSIKFVNREEDCGDPGLRKSKLSYNPVYLLEKYKVICS